MEKRRKYLVGSTVLEVKDAISIFLAETQPTGEPILIEEGYETFNIMQHGKHYFGLSQDEGAFDPKKVSKYKKCFRGDSIGRVKEAITSSLRTRGDMTDADSWQPRLIQDSYHGFNIIHFGDRYFGVSQSEGEFQIRKFQKNAYDHCYQTATADEIRNIIDKVAARSNQSKEPVLVEENYRGYNIVLFGDKYYGVFRNGEAFDAAKA